MPDVTVRKTWPGIYPTTPIPLSELFRCVWYVVDIRDEELTHTSIKCIMRFGQSEGRMERVRFPVKGVTYHTAEESEAYRRSGSWILSTLGEMLREAAREKPDVTYIAADDGSLTFAQADALSESLAASLLEIGLEPGDRAIFQFGSVKEIVVALFGCFKASVIPVCTLPQYREIEIGQLTELSGAKAYFVQGDCSPAFDLAALPRRMVQEHAILTTLIVVRGQAKAGEYDFAELISRHSRADARAATRRADALPGDVALFQLSGGSTGVPKIIPRMHAEYLGSANSWSVRHGLGPDDVSLWALPLIHNAGMLLMLVPSLISRRKLVIQAKFDVDAFLRAIETHRVTYTGSIGPIAPRIIECPDIEAYDLSTVRRLFTIARAEAVQQKTGIECHHIYGITEGMLMSTSVGDRAEARFGTLGWPTGIDDEACVLKIGSEHPSVNDVRVVAMPDPFFGEKACAFIIPKPGETVPSVAALGEFLQREGLAKFKLPERVEAIAEFPVTRVGKVDKQALRRMISDTLAREAASQSPKVA